MGFQLQDLQLNVYVGFGVLKVFLEVRGFGFRDFREVI